jgi:DNA-binding response OmpR family regulator
VSQRLLLADDSITIQKVVELILAEEDFEIKSVNNGEEALAVISSFMPDIILADIEMPKINGYQLCETIKRNPAMNTIPVILLTGAFEPIDEELAKQVQADDFIIKPFESQELISKINAVLTISSVAEAEFTEEAAVEAEAVELEAEAVSFEEEAPAEDISLEEDLWAMEEPAEIPKLEGWPAEESIAPGAEEFIQVEEEMIAEIETPAKEELKPRPAESPYVAGVKAGALEAELPSKDEFKKYFETIVNEKMSSLVASLDLKEAVLAQLLPLMKDSIEKILWEVAPDLVERMLKEMLKGTLESLTKEVEKVIWETVPDLAETMISKEIERIRSEF